MWLLHSMARQKVCRIQGTACQLHCIDISLCIDIPLQHMQRALLGTAIVDMRTPNQKACIQGLEKALQ